MIKIFTMGGSIDKYYDLHASEFVVGPPIVRSMLLEANVGVEFNIEEIIRKDSLEITKKERELLYRRVQSASETRIIITHGTDTMIHTARKLKSIPNKVIVLTGAMQPAAFKDTDAHFNLGGALIAVQLLDPGVYFVMNGRVFTPEYAYKDTEKRQFEVMSDEE